VRLWRTFLTIKPQRPLRARRKPLNMENPIVPALILRAGQAPITSTGGDMVREAVRFKIKTSAFSVPSAVKR